MRNCAIIFIFLFLGTFTYSQQSGIPIAPWRLLSYSGNISLNGAYYNSNLESVGGEHFGYKYGAGGLVTTRSYVYHPNFLTLTVSGGYQPQYGEVISSIVPNYLTSLSSLQYNINADFFKTLDYKVIAYLDYYKKNGVDQFYDRKITTKKWGAELKYDKNYKIRTHFEHNVNKELDNNTNRELKVSVTSLGGSVMKSFFNKDHNELVFNIQSTTSELKEIFNNSSDLAYAAYTNMIFLNKKQSIPLNTKLFISNQKGTYNTLSTGFNENISLPIAKQLKFNSSFGLKRTDRESQLTKELNLNGSLSHGIYSSLQNNLSINYNNVDQMQSYKLENMLLLFNTNYGKKIPFIKGHITINYQYEYQQQNKKNGDISLSIFNEEHLLQDGSIVLLDNPNSIIESVIVKDVTGTIIYQENIDYILIQRGVNVEIQRLIGGSIENNSVVFIDYYTFQNASYEYNGNGGEFNTKINFFNRLLLLEYLYSYKNYTVISGNPDILGLNTFKSNKYSAHLSYKMFSGGVYYADYDSSVLPFKLWSYYFSAYGSISKKINFKINAKIDDYIMYFNENDTNKLTIISSDLNYRINYSTRLNFNFSYSEQTGNVQDYYLISGRGEIKKRINQLEFSLGVNYFNRKVPNQGHNIQYLGTNINIRRNF